MDQSHRRLDRRLASHLALMCSCTSSLSGMLAWKWRSIGRFVKGDRSVSLSAVHGHNTCGRKHEITTAREGGAY